MLTVRRLIELTHTLRFRLIAWMTLVVAFIVSLTMLALREAVQHDLRVNFDHTLIEVANDTAQEVALLYVPKRTSPLFAHLQEKEVVHSQMGWFAEIYTEDRKLLWQSNNTPEGLNQPRFRADLTECYDSGDQRLMEASLTLPRGRGVLWIRNGCSREPLDHDVTLLNHIMILSTGLILLLTPVGGFVLASRATRPIARIISTAARLQPSKLDERLPIRGTGDELDQLSRTFNSMLDRVASYLDRNREFVANAAHELRSPLAAIRSSVDVALNHPRSAEEYSALLTDLSEECAQLSDLVNRLLLLAEGDAGRLMAGESAAQLDRVVRSSVEMFEAVAETRGVSIRLAEVDAATVRGEDTHLRQVVRNLLDNAIKFSGPGGQVELELRADPLQRLATLKVRDTGVGIPPEMLPRVFERFYRADRSRRRDAIGGHGLGLSICQSIVQALGGEIYAQSTVGKGSEFTVQLPLAESPLPDRRTKVELQAPTTVDPG